MSSMRNAVARRPHKERSQTSGREKWGLLEKHKDYSLRAADYNLKKKKLGVLSQKAKERNPDEFAFGMLSSGPAGRHGQKGTENRLSNDAVKLLKTQDAGYLRTTMGRTRKELEKVVQEIEVAEVLRSRHDTNAPQKGKVLFDEDGQPVTKRRKVSLKTPSEVVPEEPSSRNTDNLIAIRLQDDLEDSTVTTSKTGQTSYKSSKQLQKEKDRLAQLKLDRKKRKRIQEARTAKLEMLRKRQKEMVAVADALELQRLKMAGNVGGVNSRGIKFKVRERKK